MGNACTDLCCIRWLLIVFGPAGVCLKHQVYDNGCSLLTGGCLDCLFSRFMLSFIGRCLDSLLVETANVYVNVVFMPVRSFCLHNVPKILAKIPSTED